MRFSEQLLVVSCQLLVEGMDARYGMTDHERLKTDQGLLSPPARARSRNWVAACMIASSVAWARGICAVRRPSQRTRMRSATVKSSGSSLEVMMMARPSAASLRIRR